MARRLQKYELRAGTHATRVSRKVFDIAVCDGMAERLSDTVARIHPHMRVWIDMRADEPRAELATRPEFSQAAKDLRSALGPALFRLWLFSGRPDMAAAEMNDAVHGVRSQWV